MFLGVCCDVYVSFFPVSHTDVDIDKAFITTSCQPRNNNSITMEVMVQQLSKCYNEHTTVSSVKVCVNLPNLCYSAYVINLLTNQANCTYIHMSANRYANMKRVLALSEFEPQSGSTGKG